MKEFTTYTISNFEKGYCNVFPLRRIIPHFGHVIRFRLQFDESIKYQCVDPNDQKDFHKCIGAREATKEDNSCRLGVRWYEEQLQFAPYIHFKGRNLGKENPDTLYATPNIKEEIEGYLLILDTGYELNVNGHGIGNLPRGGGGPCFFRMWPFVQGHFLNPKPVTIKLKIL